MSFSLKIYLWYELWIFLIIKYEWGIIILVILEMLKLFCF